MTIMFDHFSWKMSFINYVNVCVMFVYVHYRMAETSNPSRAGIIGNCELSHIGTKFQSLQPLNIYTRK